jgi:hypothetical protein
LNVQIQTHFARPKGRRIPVLVYIILVVPSPAFVLGLQPDGGVFTSEISAIFVALK